MKGKFVSGLTAGLVLGAAASIMMVPQMDHRTRRRIDRTSRRLAHSAGNIISDIMERTR